jgi:hypothetical protein
MKNLLILSMVFLAACSKSIDEPARQLGNKEKENCSFGVTQFNLTKRATVKDETNSRNKKPTTGGGTTTPSATTGVILLDFNGHIVTGTSWNVSGDINCAPANLSSNEISLIVQRATNDYSPFNIIVTTDESVYNNANNAKRMRVVITETWEWYGQSGGVAYINSFGWADNTPCFVFSSLLNYNVKMIAEACSHEAGHTLGLRHQSTYDGNCIKTSEYNYGQGTGETGWAPIMGAGYNQNLTLWHKGPNSISCSTIQDDVAIIAGAVGFKTDDYSNTTANAASLTGSADGIIANSDVDFFSINLVTTKTISLIPFNVGIGNAGANLDMVLKIYNTQGQLISAIDNSTALNAATVLSPGNYYVSASTAGNLYTSAYGMLGKYTISLN